MVSWVVGPKHLWLGVKFARKPVVPTVAKHPSIGNCCHGEIDQSQLVAAVVAGASEYDLHPERIEYVENDSPAYNLYAHCARLLAEYATKDAAPLNH
ncbi:MAG: hypothetical protein JNM56_16180 [Planctomycetia bacterium]|nr:hypothetical protein [Planctomycetia bacterium]